MSNIFDEDAIGAGLDGVDLQAMAKRQLVASAAVAVVIGLGVILMAMAPASRNYAEVATHRSSTVQQPQFVSRTIDGVAEVGRQRRIELP
jgi:hypothetical protein